MSMPDKMSAPLPEGKPSLHTAWRAQPAKRWPTTTNPPSLALTEEHLIGWLCIMRHNLDENGSGAFCIPRCVKQALVDRGWVTTTAAEDGTQWLHVLDPGTLVSDLAAPEWGIDPIGGLT
jgi:hypothetical protein